MPQNLIFSCCAKKKNKTNNNLSLKQLQSFQLFSKKMCLSSCIITFNTCLSLSCLKCNANRHCRLGPIAIIILTSDSKRCGRTRINLQKLYLATDTSPLHYSLVISQNLEGTVKKTTSFYVAQETRIVLDDLKRQENYLHSTLGQDQ